MSDNPKPQNLPEMPNEQDTAKRDPLDETRATDLGGTRGLPPMQPPRQQNYPPVQQNRQAIPPPPAHANQARRPPQQGRYPHAQHIPKRGSARARRDSGFYLPLWSLVLMLFIVIAIAGGIVLLVVSLGNTTIGESDPVFVIITAVPTQRPAEFPASPATATIPPAVDPNNTVNATPVQPLALAGPTLAPVVFTPTPRILTVGENVVVVDVGDDQLNVRDSAGVQGTEVIFRAPEGTEFTIVDGPLQSDGLTWWRIQSVVNGSLSGWAAANYLQIAPLADQTTP